MAQTEITINDLMHALDDCAEASRELVQAQSEYTGYSPSYHLASWYEVEEKAKERLKAALDGYIAQQIKLALLARASESREP